MRSHPVLATAFSRNIEQFVQKESFRRFVSDMGLNLTNRQKHFFQLEDIRVL
jgi:hypothetical protein